MTLQHAILVSLSERTASGYDLARRFDASIGHFWQASHQQIYKVLARMEAEGLVESGVVAQDGRPDKKVYALTQDGRTELTDWLATPTPREPLRSEFAVKLRALHLADRHVILADVRRRRDHHAAQLAAYEASAERHYPDSSTLSDEQVGPWLVLRGGIHAERTSLAWLDEIIDRLDTP